VSDDFIKDHRDGVTVKVKVTPRSSRCSVILPIEDILRIRLTSPPTEGRANKELLKFLGKKLGLAPSDITIIQGRNSREKILLISGMDRKSLVRKLLF
jgi:uncharacterized protein